MATLILDGGYHNSKSTSVKLTAKAAEAYKWVERGMMDKSEFVETYLTPFQAKRLDRHFCGIDGCTCGSFARASFEIKK